MTKITSPYVVGKEYLPSESWWRCLEDGCEKGKTSSNSGAASGGGHSHCRSVGHQVETQAVIRLKYVPIPRTSEEDAASSAD